jgi:hypothetical protein
MANPETIGECEPESGSDNDVIFAGERNDPQFLSGVDVVALTSRNEGTPLTLIEAI